ncbi:MAG: hypothetical protein ABIK28_12465 [Planctomycetota bacterium]
MLCRTDHGIYRVERSRQSCTEKKFNNLLVLNILASFGFIQTYCADVIRKRPVRIHEKTSLIFVLMPGCSFDMDVVTPGENYPPFSPNADPLAEPIKGPIHQVAIRAFLLSKYEMTQGRWRRFTGEIPCTY